jgi:hypothetical protein
MISGKLLRVGEGRVGAQHRRALPGSIAVKRCFDGLAGGEFRSFGRRDRDRLAGLRITPLSLTTLGDPERPKAGNANLVTLLQRIRHNIPSKPNQWRSRHAPCRQY